MRQIEWQKHLSIGVLCVLASCASSPVVRPELSGDARLRVAEAADAAGNRDLAISMYMEAASTAPSNAKLVLRCAYALARDGRPKQARQILAERLHATPAEPDLLRAMALIDLVSGQSMQAIAELDQLLVLAPADHNALVDKGIALDLLSRHAEAQNIYKQALAAMPNDPETINNLAMSMMLEGRVQEARELLEPFRDVGGVSDRLKENLAILDATLGDTTRSREFFADRVSAADLSSLTASIRSLPAGKF